MSSKWSATTPKRRTSINIRSNDRTLSVIKLLHPFNSLNKKQGLLAQQGITSNAKPVRESYEKDVGPIVEPSGMDLSAMPFASALLSQTLGNQRIRFDLQLPLPR